MALHNFCKENYSNAKVRIMKDKIFDEKGCWGFFDFSCENNNYQLGGILIFTDSNSIEFKETLEGDQIIKCREFGFGNNIKISF